MEKADAENHFFHLKSYVGLYSCYYHKLYWKALIEIKERKKSEKPLSSLKFNNTIFKYPMDQRNHHMEN